MVPHQTCNKTFLCKPYFSKWVFQIPTFEEACDLEKKVKVINLGSNLITHLGLPTDQIWSKSENILVRIIIIIKKKIMTKTRVFTTEW
jgi:hypothetical protein